MPFTQFRGPVERQPVLTDAKVTAAALLPSTFVTEGATSLSQATSPGPNVRLLAARDWYSVGQFDANDPLAVSIASGDTAHAFILEPGQRYLVAAASATYTFGQELTVATAGRAAAATTGNIVVAFSREAGTKSAGAMLEVEIANFYAKP